MFRILSNFTDTEFLLEKLIGHKNVGFGDTTITEKPITTFYDYSNAQPYLHYNPYNIFIQFKPDDVTHLNDWIIENSYMFSGVLTKEKKILDSIENSVEIQGDTEEEVLENIRTIILQIIKDNDIQESTYWSQELEDKWIDENLILPEPGFFLDIGGCYPKIISNTYFFESKKRWNGLMIEPDPNYFKLLQSARKCFLEQKAISTKIGTTWFMPMTKVLNEKTSDSIEVECIRLDTLLQKYNIQKIDLISIDIEGNEMDAWATFNYKEYNPKVIIVEHTEFGRYDRSFTDYLLQNKDYYIAHQTSLNYILLHKDVQRKKS